MFGDTFEHLAILYKIATGRPSTEALIDYRSDPPGELARLSDPFVDGMAAIGPPKREGQDLVGEWSRLASEWLTQASWIRGMKESGLRTQVFLVAYACRQASDKGLQAWAWHGKSVPPYAVATGAGLQSYEQYRLAKGRPRK